MMRHIKKFAALLLAAICTMMVLTGCVDKASLYDDTQQIAAGRTAYSATGYQGGYVMGDGSFDFTASADKLVGAVEAFDIDVKNESTLVDCYTTADTTSGKFKILLVHTDNKQIVAEYIDDTYSDLVLTVGNYKVYLVGKDDAAFNAGISLYCFGENVSWYEPSKK